MTRQRRTPEETVCCLRLTVDGCPVPKGRPRFAGRVAFTPGKTRAAERTLKLEALAAGWRPLDGPLAVSLSFYLPDHRRVDLDNLGKLVCDALNGIAWRDDSQIVTLELRKSAADPMPRTEIEVLRVGEAVGRAAP